MHRSQIIDSFLSTSENQFLLCQFPIPNIYYPISFFPVDNLR